MFCKPEVKLILESLRAEREIGRAEIRQGEVVIKGITAAHTYRITRHGHLQYTGYVLP